MRITLPLVALVGTLGQAYAQSDAPTTKSKSGRTSSTGVDLTVSFLQSLQQAQISSMTCLISLVNMTTQPVGACLGLSELATILFPVDNGTASATGASAAGSSKASSKAAEKRATGSGRGAAGNTTADGFAGQLETYLTSICEGAQCDPTELQEARTMLSEKCGSQMKSGLVPMLDAIMANYASSYKTLACSVQYNGTAENCLTSSLAANPASNNPGFFIDLLSGSNLAQYATSVFQALPCTGCVHELYKAAVFLMPAVRGSQITSETGGKLKDTCTTSPPAWDTIMDEAMPEALTVKQSTPSSRSAADHTRGLAMLGTIISLVVAGLFFSAM